MATFAGRRAPNVSQYISNLNVVQPEGDDGLGNDDAYNFEADLHMFTNTDFFEYPVGDNALEQSILDYAPSQDERGGRANEDAKKEYPHGLDMANSMFIPIALAG